MITSPRGQLIDGNALSSRLRAEVAARAQALKARGLTPGLAVILVGDDPASAVYVRNKVKACADTGVHSIFEKYDSSLTETALLARISALNLDPKIAAGPLTLALTDLTTVLVYFSVAAFTL